MTPRTVPNFTGCVYTKTTAMENIPIRFDNRLL